MIIKNPQTVDVLVMAAVLEEKASLEIGEFDGRNISLPSELACALQQEISVERKTREEQSFLEEIKKELGNLTRKFEELKVDKNTQRDKKPVQCFRCLSFGHLQNVCPHNFLQMYPNIPYQNFRGRNNYRTRGRNFYRPPRANYNEGRNYYQHSNTGSNENREN